MWPQARHLDVLLVLRREQDVLAGEINHSGSDVAGLLFP